MHGKTKKLSGVMSEVTSHVHGIVRPAEGAANQKCTARIPLAYRHAYVYELLATKGRHTVFIATCDVKRRMRGPDVRMKAAAKLEWLPN